MTKVVILKGKLFVDSQRITKRIRAEAEGHELLALSIEQFCLIQIFVTKMDMEAMGLTWIVALSKPINDSSGVQRFLYADRGPSGCFFGLGNDYPDRTWPYRHGFVFGVPVDHGIWG